MKSCAFVKCNLSEKWMYIIVQIALFQLIFDFFGSLIVKNENEVNILLIVKRITMAEKDIISKEILKNIARDIARHILHIDVKQDREFKNYFKMVSILSTNRDLQDEVKKGAKMLSIDIKKTPIYELGMEDGIQKGIQNRVNSVALKLLNLHIDIEIIHKTTGLNFDEIEQLKEKLND